MNQTQTAKLAAQYRKALTMPAGAGTYTARDMSAMAQQITNQGFPSTVADALLLPRPSDQFIGAFGPSSPAQPTPVDLVREGRVLPRRWQYPVGYDLPSPPGSYKLIDFRTLRNLADIYDILRRAIEIRKQEVATMDWEVTFKDPDRARAYTAQARARSRAVAQGRTIATQELSEDDVAIKELTAFWEQPDPIRQLGFDDWTKQLMEELLVIDALAVFPHPTWLPGRGRLGSDLYALEVLDGSTIKPLIDIRGAPPTPPAPAYQQFIWGIPRTEMQQDLLEAQTRPLQAAPPDGLDREFQVPSMYGDLDAPQLHYRVYHPRSFTLYGFSNVEQMLIHVNLALKRQQWWTSYYTDGTVPAGLLHVPEEWTASEVREYEEAWNSLLAGDIAWKHRVRAVPGSRGFSELRPAIGTETGVTALDEWLARITCLAVDVTPDELGLQPRSGLGGQGYAAGQENVTYRKSLKPLTKWIEALGARVHTRHYRRPDLLLKFQYAEAEDSLKKAQEDQILITVGAKTQAEARQDRGLDPYEGDLGTEPLILLRAGALKLSDVDAMSASLSAPPPPPMLPPAPGQPPQPGQQEDAQQPGRREVGTSRQPRPPAGAVTKALGLWQVQALRRLRAGRQALDPPRGAEVPSDTARVLRDRLAAAATPDEVRAAFAEFLQPDAA